MGANIRQLVLRLRDEKRRGWLARGVPHDDCESVAEHSFAVAAYCSLYAPQAFQNKAIELALAHDLAETITGDIIPSDGISKSVKVERESLAYQFFQSVDAVAGASLEALWQEYEENQTPAARFVHDIDRFQRLEQAFKYAVKYPSLDFRDFQNDASNIQDATLIEESQRILEKWQTWKAPVQKVIFVIGGPGVGKGTQCSLAAQALGALHLSAGQLLRDEQSKPNSPFRDFIANSFKASVPVPPSLIIDLLRRNLLQEDAIPQQGIALLDGFPRSMAQLEAFENEMSTSYATIQLLAEDQTLALRLQERSQVSQRVDDLPENILKRVQGSHYPSLILDHLKKRPFITVDGEGHVEEVKGLFLKAIEDLA